MIMCRPTAREKIAPERGRAGRGIPREARVDQEGST